VKSARRARGPPSSRRAEKGVRGLGKKKAKQAGVKLRTAGKGERNYFGEKSNGWGRFKKDDKPKRS